MTVFLVNPSGRRAKNAKRNAPRRPKRETFYAELWGGSQQAYRGYLIVGTPQGYHIERDGFVVGRGYATPASAKKVVDELTSNPPGGNVKGTSKRNPPAALRWVFVGRAAGRAGPSVDTWHGYHNVPGGDRVATLQSIGPGRYSVYSYPDGREIAYGAGTLAVAKRQAGRWWNLRRSNPQGAPRGARSSNPTGGRNMARRMPPRNAKGRFVKRGGSTKRKARRRAAARTAPRRRRRRSNPAPAARRRRRRNPPRLDVVGRLSGGFMDALALTGGQAAVRIIPRTLRLPTAGMVGLAVSSAVGVGVGMLAEQVVSRDTARLITAGALSVPLQQAALQYVAPAVPFVGAALSPTLGSYARTRLGAYSRQALPPVRRTSNARGMGGYDYAAVGGGSY